MFLYTSVFRALFHSVSIDEFFPCAIVEEINEIHQLTSR